MSQIKKLIDAGLIHKGSYPKHFPDSIQYETIMGSVAYGVSNDMSDVDIYGFCIPPKHIIFPHLNGHILGFGSQPEKFEQWQQHHIEDKENGKTYDASIFNIVKYFDLCMSGNPNMINSLFVPINVVLHLSSIGQMARENRKKFLHKGCMAKFKGYAFSQLHKIKTKKPEGSRKEKLDEEGTDLKYCYHLVRLIDECEQILTEGDLDLQRNSEKLKAIRRGEWKLADVEEYFTRKEKDLETVYVNSKLPDTPNEGAIRQLLLDCLEHHFGNLNECIVATDKATRTLNDISSLLKERGY